MKNLFLLFLLFSLFFVSNSVYAQTQTPPTPTPTPISCNPLDIDSKCPDGTSCELYSVEDEPKDYTCVPATPIPTFAASDICAQKSPDGKVCEKINTALGLIDTEPKAFVKWIFSFVLGISGGIALLLIMLAGYKMMASQGNAEQITAAREQFTSAIIGLLFIIFSFVILQVIGVDILKIPGFSK